MASHGGEEHRHEVDGSKKSGAQDETQHTTNGKASMTKYPKIDKGLWCPEHPARPSRDGKNADNQQANDQRRSPAALWRFLDGDLDGCKAQRHQSQGKQVEKTRL